SILNHQSTPHTFYVMSDKKEQEFTIQPIDPSTRVESTPGLMGDRSAPVASAPGPHITSAQLPEADSREELTKRAEELNKK
ncbi:MAG: hypothetical protein CYPHOPRED_004331, partial [Cyphobasidiales sp. Tagirdzhanova-0007]